MDRVTTRGSGRGGKLVRKPVLAALLALATMTVALPGIVLARDVRPALAPTPNTSIILYKPPVNGKPGRAVIGTLIGGVFTKKGAFNTRRWTSIAVGRDSMALYDRKSGKLVTGRFRNGVWKPVRTRTIATGYTHVVASCDSIYFYKRSTGSGTAAEFTSGEVRDMRRNDIDTDAYQDDYNLLAASCDTLLALGDDGDGDGPVAETGLHRDGYFEDSVGLAAAGRIWTHLTANATSYLHLDVPAGGSADGAWGQLRNGDRVQTGSDDGFDPWDIIAGVTDSVLLYERSSGSAAVVLLVDGGDLGIGSVALGKGWRIIAGGK
jgi:hypothetical protein